MQTFFIDFLDLLRTYPALFYFYITLISLAVGSFLNVVIYRIPLMMKREWRQECCALLELDADPAGASALPKPFNLMWPLSHCPGCKHNIAAYDNIPLLSFCWLRGRCRHCQKKISPRYFLIECLTLIMSLVVGLQFGVSVKTVIVLLVTWLLIAMSFIDIDEMFIPDEMAYSLLWGGLFVSLFHVFISPGDAIIGALVGYLSLWFIAFVFQIIMGKQGMGHGDFKLCAGLCAFCGWAALPFIALAASVSGLVMGVGLMLFKGHARSAPIPFGPFLAIAGWLALLLIDANVQLLPLLY